MSISRTLLWFLLLLIAPALTCFSQTRVSLTSLLEEMVNYRTVASWPNPVYTTKQASSYDRASSSPDVEGWFANSDQGQYIRSEDHNGHKEQVMMEADGPGAIVRFWLTTFKRKGILRVYLDQAIQPVLEIPAYDLMQSGLSLGPALLNPHSSYEPKEKGGSTLYLPIPYAKHCKVTFEEQEPKQPRYYQINYRTYPPNTPVQTFDLKTLASVSNLLGQVEKKLWTLPRTTDKSVNHTEVIQPGQTYGFDLPPGSSVVDELKLHLLEPDSVKYAQALRSTILQISFDGIKTVWCPVGDFSGSGVGGKPLHSWYRTVQKDGTVISRWTMPYQHKARIMIQNLGSDAVKIASSVTVSRRQWTAKSMYFFARWKQTRQVPIQNSDQKPQKDAIEWNMISLRGKGLYVGNTLSVYNHMHTWYGEGDQKLWVDDEKFPSEFGTGTEDYYNTSWAPVVLYQTPFANAPRADNADSFGYNTFTRTRNLDGVPFNHTFKMDLEMLGWKQGMADFATVIYWYGFKDTICVCEPMEAEASAKLP